MATRALFPFQDYSEETSTTSVRVIDAITDLQFTDLYTAIVGMAVDGEQQSKKQVTTFQDGLNSGPATSKLAQRENKFLVSYVEAVSEGKSGTFEIPCADLTLVVGNTDKVDLAAGAGLALKTQVELYVLSPAGNAVTVTSVKFVGRKL